jgi:hypothetical protein
MPSISFITQFTIYELCIYTPGIYSLRVAYLFIAVLEYCAIHNFFQIFCTLFFPYWLTNNQPHFLENSSHVFGIWFYIFLSFACHLHAMNLVLTDEGVNFNFKKLKLYLRLLNTLLAEY